MVDGITIPTPENFNVSTEKPKSMKTFNMSAIVAAALLSKEVLHYRTIRTRFILTNLKPLRMRSHCRMERSLVYSEAIYDKSMSNCYKYQKSIMNIAQIKQIELME